MWKLFITFLIITSLSSVFAAADTIDDLDTEDWNEEDDEILRDIEAKQAENARQREDEVAKALAKKIISAHLEVSLNNKTPIQVDLCAAVHCSAGKICQTDGDSAKCICIPECPEINEPRRKVCTNLNETWPSDCEVHRQRCLCEQGDVKCKNKQASHIHIDYYGECKDLPECTEDEMKDFPRRIREWLFNVMLDLANRNELPQHYIAMTHEAETNLTKRWTNAAIWKFCDLDVEGDRSVSRHELFPIRAPLVALEHCIAPFLEGCDENDDHRITLIEWGNCLELKEGELTERCAGISKDNKITAF